MVYENMKNLIIFLIVFLCVLNVSAAKDVSFIVLGDLHYDKLEFHDLDWLKNKWRNPDDYRQVTEEYVVYTEKYWHNTVSTLKFQVQTFQPEISAVLQLGDLMEGLAGSPEYARKMANGAVRAIQNANLNIPWILVKGNHDGWYGPGEPESYKEIIVPFANAQLGINSENSFYTYRLGPVEFICCPDSQDKDAIVKFIEESLINSRAKYKFVAMHTPVIPVTGRCWNLFNFRNSSEHDKAQRAKLLGLLAKHKVIVLCAHLHRYSLVKRSTPDGPIIQIMLNSVIRQNDANTPYWKTESYGPGLVDLEPQFAPETQQQRRNSLTEEAKYVNKFYLADMPGYAIISASDNEDKLIMNVFCGYNKKPIFTENLTTLIK